MTKAIKIFVFILFLLFTLSSCKKNEVKNDYIIKEKNKNEEQNKKDEILQSGSENEIRKEEPEKYKPGFENYVNSRFGYSFKYPADIKRKSESANGDGCEFIYSDNFNIKVYGSNDPGVLNQSLEDFYKSELKNHKDITYKKPRKITGL